VAKWAFFVLLCFSVLAKVLFFHGRRQLIEGAEGQKIMIGIHSIPGIDGVSLCPGGKGFRFPVRKLISISNWKDSKVHIRMEITVLRLTTFFIISVLEQPVYPYPVSPPW